MIEKKTAGFGQTDSASDALEQRRTHLLFQLLNLDGECWLRYVQRLRCLSEMQAFSACDEVTEVSEFHSLYKCKSLNQSIGSINDLFVL